MAKGDVKAPNHVLYHVKMMYYIRPLPRLCTQFIASFVRTCLVALIAGPRCGALLGDLFLLFHLFLLCEFTFF